MTALTIGMATYNDFDGVYFTLQALRLSHDLEDVELLVVDNYGCETTRQFVESWVKGRYVLATEVSGTAAPRDRVFREASGEAVLCCDSHVLFAPGAIAKLKAYHRVHPESVDLLQGPLVYDDLASISTHFEQVWREQMWGIWATDPRGLDPEGEPFEIPMQGLGAFSCRKAAWPGFNPAFRGFGGEEGYLHEKVRQRGGRTLCLPWLRWLHRFGRPNGVPYPLTIDDKLRNYVIGHFELGLDLLPVLTHFADHLPQERVLELAAEAVREVSGITLALPLVIRPAATLAPVLFTPAEPPLISCICPTYNRAPSHLHLLEEAIESFLRQTYSNKELIVLNDTPGQELICDAPGVRIFNAPERFSSMGDKLNAAIRLAHGALIAPWDDDDISLPWRLSFSAARLGEADYFNPRAHWFLDGAGLHADHAMGVGHNLSLFTRRAFEAVGGYPAMSGGHDAVMDRAFVASLARVVDPQRGDAALPVQEWFYLYRWGVSPVHLSGKPTYDAFYREIGRRPIARGSFQVQPRWREDYEAMTRAALAAVSAPAANPKRPRPARHRRS